MAPHHPAKVTSFTREQVTLDSSSIFAKFPIIGIVLGILGLVATFLLGAGNKVQLMGAYTTSFMFWLGIGIGCYFFVAIYFATRAAWGSTVRRIAENAMSALPVFALLFIPIVFGLDTIYHWTDAELVASSHALTWKSPYLSFKWFIIRAVFYFAVWTAFAFTYYRMSTKQDETGDHDLSRKMQFWSGPMLLLGAICVTFAGIDWIQTTDAHWFSTMFGVYYFAGAMVAALAFMLFIALTLRQTNATNGAITAEHIHGLAQLLYGFNIFWTYIAFCQFFLIWYGNIPEETEWFAYRYVGSWRVVTLALIVFHFVLPLFFLMPRYMKRAPWSVAIGAFVLFVMQYVDVMWSIKPSIFHAHGLHGLQFGLVDITAFLGIGGIFIAVVGYKMRKNALVAFKDPRLPESMSYSNM